MALFAYLEQADADEVEKCAYQYEVELKNECLLRVGWAALEGRRALGTDERSFGYGGTGMKSNCGRFEKYGEVFEAQTGAVVTCLLDRREPRRSSISYCLNGRSLGVAFRLPPWLADVPLFPAICGREDWKAICRFQDLRFPHGGFSCLEEANRGHVADDGGAASAAAAVFAAAPFVEERELKQLDVPDENLVELRSAGDDGIDERELKSWLIHEYGISSADFHAEFAEKMCIAVLAFTSHRVARSMLHAPPPGLQVSLRPAFSEEAQKILALRRPDKAATTDVVARRLIAGALDGDVKLTKEQLRQIRVKKSNTNSVSNRKVPPAPKMPTLETDTESGSSSDQMSQASAAIYRRHTYLDGTLSFPCPRSKILHKRVVQSPYLRIKKQQQITVFCILHIQLVFALCVYVVNPVLGAASGAGSASCKAGCKACSCRASGCRAGAACEETG
ncbi:Protein tofu-2 (21U-RNA biogenesis fouled up protein 2) [Durusdinium trenchii]|uniref:Protein tofu-2 (21U-RNA biogenesis fouled up protein 2) n=1 Tax=Durusdinium trenchii TaxID=1381693 RepID=A0ABP0JLZ0_9DINO